MDITRALCLTPACLRLASDFASNLSPNHAQLDACTDFEEIVCGGWKQSHDLRPDQGQVSRFSVVSDAGDDTLRAILEGPYPGESSHSHFLPRSLDATAVSIDQANFEDMQRAYNACMDVTAISNLGAKPIVDLLDHLSETFASHNLSDSFAYLGQLGISPIVIVHVDSDPKDPDVQIVHISPSTGIGLGSKDYYKKASLLAEYQHTMAHVLKTIHPMNMSSGDWAEEAVTVVQLETRIANVTPDLVDLRDVEHSIDRMTVQEASRMIPQLSVDRTISSLAPANHATADVIVQFPTFLRDVSAILSETPLETLQVYLLWKVIQAFENYIIAPEALKPYQRLKNKLRGREPDSAAERWRRCLSQVDGDLGWILSRFFIDNTFSARDRNLGNQIIANIRNVYFDKFSAVAWMEKVVKKAAAEKVREMEQKIGYPSEAPNITDPVSLRDYYADITISDSYFVNMIAVVKWGVKQRWLQLSKPTDRKRWAMTASTVNAYYDLGLNEIVFPAGIMQPPIFHGDLPSYVNYGGFGAIAGHEISHGFDVHGRMFDSRGRNLDWWTNATSEEYNRRAGCFVDQYSNFTVPVGKNKTAHINGKQTQGENIADAAGLDAAFAAWQRVRNGQQDLDLPGLNNFSHEQLFFVAFGNLWCMKATPGSLQNQVLTGVHSPGSVRIKGTLMNSRQFRDAFSCPTRDPTCELW
ncbi:hypothetical protein B0T26DRAFT_861663 [Lasiosphaeria miniovina]|uniref:Endothelin-converting enzyme 1 n=1 Tax=Lasiosphaeria miniovina TaxID=1954250 RepID=A0AA40A6Q5_9PEZI|nr:uncharacterized protein B0T26DRAFT_861663 [Lasiosphaeria miniovina]KAK0710327.1 hypothetical protein B0T26DRAFT_861663 [Lasiosphaeria miniovina]